MQEELAAYYNYDVVNGIYLDGTTYADHDNDEVEPNLHDPEFKSSGSLIKDLMDAVKKSQEKK